MSAIPCVFEEEDDSASKEVPQLKSLNPRPRPDDLIEAVCSEFGGDRERLLQKGKKRIETDPKLKGLVKRIRKRILENEDPGRSRRHPAGAAIRPSSLRLKSGIPNSCVFV